MSYSSGFLNKRITILKRVDSPSVFGYNSDGVGWSDAGDVWANITWSKGVNALRVGAVDAYNIIMVRMRYCDIDKFDRLRRRGKVYAIDSINKSYTNNEVQITAHEVVNP